VHRCRGSRWYDTAPVGGVATHRFLNAALELQTDLAPAVLLGALQDVERSLGRSRDVRWDDRTLDLDLLLWEDQIVELPELVIPHPELPRRRFVLAPLCDLAPDALHPLLGRRLVDLLRALPEDPGDACRPLAPELLEAAWPGWMRSS
jgi:2-amino-4-hydroxy-6-hydroxymethyldihydropteridine diphosphokinase